MDASVPVRCLQACYAGTGDRLVEDREQDIQLKVLKPGEGEMSIGPPCLCK